LGKKLSTKVSGGSGERSWGTDGDGAANSWPKDGKKNKRVGRGGGQKGGLKKGMDPGGCWRKKKSWGNLQRRKEWGKVNAGGVREFQKLRIAPGSGKFFKQWWVGTGGETNFQEKGLKKERGRVLGSWCVTKIDQK